PHRVLLDRRHAEPPGVHRRGGPRRLRSAQALRRPGQGRDGGKRRRDHPRRRHGKRVMPKNNSERPLLQVRNLGVRFRVPGSTLGAVKSISFDIAKGETVALVGASGSGKSVTALSIMQLLPYPMAQHPPGSSIVFKGQELVGADQKLLRDVRGDQISMIFQEPMTSLNPLHTVEKQINETLFLHKGMSR